MPKASKSPVMAPSTASAFKKRSSGLLQLPSGEVVKVKNLGGLKALLSDGMIPNSLMPLVESAMTSGQVPDMKEVITKDSKIDYSLVDDMMHLNDQIAMRCVVEPKVHPVPENEKDRDDDLLYIDEIPEEDKMFIFQWVTGGTKDVEAFRKELESSMVAMGTE